VLLVARASAQEVEALRNYQKTKPPNGMQRSALSAAAASERWKSQ